MDSSQVNRSYDEAIKSLKSINDELFYSDLRTKLDSHTTQLDEKYADAINRVQGMALTVERLPVLVETEVNRAVDKLLLKIDESVRDSLFNIEKSFQAREEELYGIIENFMTLQANFQHIFSQLEESKQAQLEQWQAFLAEQKEAGEAFDESYIKEQQQFFEKFQESLGEQSALFQSKAQSMKEQLANSAELLEGSQQKGFEMLKKAAWEDSSIIKSSVTEHFGKTHEKVAEAEQQIREGIEKASERLRVDVLKVEAQQAAVMNKVTADFQKDINSVKASFENQMLALQQTAISSAEQQSTAAQEQFQLLSEKINSQQTQTDKKHKQTLWLITSLTIAQAILLASLVW